ncbi:MAG: hypothetical protein H6574_06585 [Lewinellaceae bacterium]|nr:hypothetical protein [Lewinellaceae bacterium]
MWTMLEGFQHLSSEEIDTLVAAPVNITALIGGADGEIDREERNWSEHLMRARTYSQPHLIQEYYRVASEDFLAKLDKAMAALPKEVEPRSAILTQRIESLNPILAKLDTELAATLYKSFLVLAKETAKASGGFLRIGAVSAVEYQWLDLPMLEPIHHESGDDIERIEKED